MTKINEKTFLQELLIAIPEFKEIHEREKEYHDIGIHLIFGDFKRLALDAVKQNDEKLLKRITNFIVRCHQEDRGEVDNAVMVTFFESMSERGIDYFLKNLPEDFSKKVQDYLKAYREFSNRDKFGNKKNPSKKKK